MALFERTIPPLAALGDAKALRRVAVVMGGLAAAITIGATVALIQSSGSTEPSTALPATGAEVVVPPIEFTFASAPAPTEIQFVVPEGPLPPFATFVAPPPPAPVIPPAGDGSQAAPSNNAPIYQPPANNAPQPAPAPAQPAPAPAPAQPSNFYLPAAPAGDGYIAGQVFNLMNAERAAAGLAPLAWDDGLSRVGRIRSQQMIDQGYFGHTDPYGYSMYWELLKYYGYGYAWAGENLQRNNYPYEQQAGVAVSGFMNSPAHRDNVLYSGFSRVGIGAVTASNGTVYISVIFLG